MITLDLFVSGMITGATYALAAVGITLVFGVLRIVNFAHGEFFMVGAYIMAYATTAFGMPVSLALVLAPLIGALLGIVVEHSLMRPLYTGYTSWSNERDEYAIIVTFGLSLLLINLAYQFAGPYPLRPPELVSGRIEIGTLLVSSHRVVVAAIAVSTLVGLVLFFRYSTWGKLIQAVSQNRFGASLAGINAEAVTKLVFAISGAFAALAGALLAPLFSAYPEMGVIAAVKSYVIVVLGGMGSIVGSIVGGLVLGLVETFGAVYVSYAYRDTFAFVILIAVLLLRPNGLFGSVVRKT